MLWLKTKIVLIGLGVVAVVIIVFLMFGKTNVAAEDYANLMGQVSSAEFSPRKSAFLKRYESLQQTVLEQNIEQAQQLTDGLNPWKKTTLDEYVKKNDITDYTWSQKQVNNTNYVYNVLMEEKTRSAILENVQQPEVLIRDGYINYKILICAIIGNICGEGTSGMLEGYTSKYWPGYRSKWLDSTGYGMPESSRNEVLAAYDEVVKMAEAPGGDKRIIDTLVEVNLLMKLDSFNGIGVGMVQWSNGRRYALLKKYKTYLTENNKTSLTDEELMNIESEHLISDLMSKDYSVIIKDFCIYLEENPNTPLELRLQKATGLIYARYEVPSNSFCCFVCEDQCYEKVSNNPKVIECQCDEAVPNVLRRLPENSVDTSKLFMIHENHKRMIYARTAFDNMFK